MLRSAALALTLLLPGAAWGASWSWGCKYASDNLTSVNPSNFIVRAGNLACWRFVDTDSTASSAIFIIDAVSALVCFDPDNTDAVADTSRVTLHHCPAGGVAGATGSVNTCIDTGGFRAATTLDGTEGPTSTQNACKRVGPGAYFVRVTVACAKTASDYCQVAVRGEEPAQ